MKRNHIFQKLLAPQNKTPVKSFGQAFAPSNIALCKYWGKRNLELNLPFTSSLSISLNNKGAHAKISSSPNLHHELIINNNLLNLESVYAKPLLAFLEEFTFLDIKAFRLELNFNIPIAAGLASSSSSYAAIIKAMNDFFGWQLNGKTLSILARLGSGSACRSVFEGFVQWHCGTDPAGMDSYAEPLNQNWPELCVGLHIVSSQKKTTSSREGMKRTVATSALYTAWPQKVNEDLISLKKAITQKDFSLLGRAAESNALAMHATMLAAWPPLMYSSPETIQLLKKIWMLREKGLEIYFTQDAGPNIKSLFLAQDKEKLSHHFHDLETILPFKNVIVQKVILVNEKDQPLGNEEKIKVHCEGKLHRAFSVFVFSWRNNEWQLLLQQRHPEKYHSGGLWTNTCCSHPRPGENIIEAGERRLFEEMGLKMLLKKVGEFRYTAEVSNNLIENEYDHVLVGFLTNEKIHLNKNEISAIRWINIPTLKEEFKKNPQNFTPWLDAALKIALKGIPSFSNKE
ncbi:diphosphomevalonate decarboxylase [Candidatus Coxiella mudrowiae]|uniref:Isopentenyl-diphosphate Delta-isomerase n=1 Tax=Candidatus Coxiella mudrowiae TaxID=2054173 RepID=A0ABN4HSB7_9COXI|nr:diphosphomevalonate decarboxylase [Candidatus Coxiella mudrowiae]AKQ33366.1 Diphosphomevalonate decarboxylase/isopentenyl-diphosphate delta-isomerase [Candidatus Coxiella mudrowiae]